MTPAEQLTELFLRPVDKVDSQMDYEGRLRTFKVYETPVGDQLPVVHRYRSWEGREKFEKQIGGVPVFIFTKGKP